MTPKIPRPEWIDDGESQIKHVRFLIETERDGDPAWVAAAVRDYNTFAKEDPYIIDPLPTGTPRAVVLEALNKQLLPWLLYACPEVAERLEQEEMVRWILENK